MKIELIAVGQIQHFRCPGLLQTCGVRRERGLLNPQQSYSAALDGHPQDRLPLSLQACGPIAQHIGRKAERGKRRGISELYALCRRCDGNLTLARAVQDRCSEWTRESTGAACGKREKRRLLDAVESDDRNETRLVVRDRDGLRLIQHAMQDTGAACEESSERRLRRRPTFESIWSRTRSR